MGRDGADGRRGRPRRRRPGDRPGRGELGGLRHAARGHPGRARPRPARSTTIGPGAAPALRRGGAGMSDVLERQVADFWSGARRASRSRDAQLPSAGGRAAPAGAGMGRRARAGATLEPPAPAALLIARLVDEVTINETFFFRAARASSRPSTGAGCSPPHCARRGPRRPRLGRRRAPRARRPTRSRCSPARRSAPRPPVTILGHRHLRRGARRARAATYSDRSVARLPPDLYERVPRPRARPPRGAAVRHLARAVRAAQPGDAIPSPPRARGASTSSPAATSSSTSTRPPSSAL